MDIGMHTGEDTARYLARGFEVVAVEANPDIVKAASRTFRDEILSGQLKIIGAAVSETHGTASFAVSDAMTIWSSLSPEFIKRNEHAGISYRHVEVETIPFEDVLNEHGVPYYLKIDIEGHDMLCVRALHGYREKPAFVSIESHVSISTASAEATFDELAQLWALGYRRFRYVNQAQDGSELPLDGGGAWLSVKRALALSQLLRLLHNLGGFGGRWPYTIPGRSFNRARAAAGRRAPWYDLQAALPIPRQDER
jgi:FkbM family methyltransferase